MNTTTTQETEVEETTMNKLPNDPPKLVDIEVKNENTALNLLVAFVQHAHAKGVFSIQESAKIWECINKFQGPR